MFCHIFQSIRSHMQIMKEVEELRLESKIVRTLLAVWICPDPILSEKILGNSITSISKMT